MKMTKEYQDDMQEEFKAWYINADLAGQSYGMIDCWYAACTWATAQQIEKDAGICDANTIKFPPCTCAENIRNQENE